MILFKIIRSIEKKSEFWEKALWWKWDKKEIDYYGLKKFWRGTKTLIPDHIKYSDARGHNDHTESMKQVIGHTKYMDECNGLVQFLHKDANLTHGRLSDSGPHQLELAFIDTMHSAKSFKKYLNEFYVKSAFMGIGNGYSDHCIHEMAKHRENIYDSWLKSLIKHLGGTYDAFNFQAAKKYHFESEELKIKSRTKEGKVSRKQKKYIDQIGKFEKFIHILENANEFKLYFNQQ